MNVTKRSFNPIKFKHGVMTLVAALTLTTALSASAALSVDQSRYIFEGNKDAISIVVENADKQTYGGQTWIENIKETDTRPTFVVTPPFFKVAGNSKQVLRVIKALDEMPEDKESIYWINLQEIPPANKDGGLSIALRTKVKLLYRPESLMAGRKEAEKGLSLETIDGKTTLVNTTPYIFAIAELLNEQDKPLNLDQKAHDELAMFIPGQVFSLPAGDKAQKVVAIDDLGYPKTYPIEGKGRAAALPVK